MRFLRAIPLSVSFLLLLLGLGGIVTTLVGLIVTAGSFLNEGARITVPASVEVVLDPEKPHRVYHELNGSHITINQPFADLPADTVIGLSDAATGLPIESQNLSEPFNVNFFALRDRRLAVRAFTPPPGGRVRVDVSGTFPSSQVLYIGPTHTVYATGTLRGVQASFVVSLGVILLAAAGFVARINPAEPDLTG